MSDYPNLDAKYYHRHSFIQRSLVDGILQLHDFKQDERILDIGCGDGTISARLATIVHEGSVLGIDASLEMITFAKQHFPKKQFNNLRFKNIAAEKFCCDNQYSLITAFNSLYWIKDLNRTFSNIYHSLSHNGRVLALIYPLESPYWELFIQTFKTPAFSKWYDNSICAMWITTEEYIKMAKGFGFTVLCADTYVESVNYPDKQAFKDYVNGWLPCMFSSPNEVMNQYLNAVTELAWDLYGNDDGSAALPYKKLYLYLEKSIV